MDTLFRNADNKNMFKTARILLLLFILALVAASAWLTRYRTASWEETQWVAVYPVNPQDSPVVQHYIDRLDDDHFAPMGRFFAEEAKHYGLDLNPPVKTVLAHQVNETPPPPPKDQSVLSVMWWSLKLRYWAWQVDHYEPTPHIRIFVQYFDPDVNKSLRHSLGLDKGMIGVVNAFASRLQASRNQVIIAHEVLHTLGASDKYDLQTGRPIHPQGYAHPQRTPLHPQEYAEIMGARIAISETEAKIPPSLDHTLIGELTAQEINWSE